MLKFTDVKSGRDVVLVGVMHFNPVSIQAVERVVADLAGARDLGAILVESCPARWATAEEDAQVASGDDEMQVAAALAEANGCGFALADQDIDVTSGRLAQLCKLSLIQLFTPLSGGWQHLGRDLASGWAALQPADGDGVTSLAFVDGQLLLGAPVALRRWLSSNPEVVALLVGAAAVLGAADGAALFIGGGDPVYPWEVTSLDAVLELLPSVGIALVESVLLMRILLVGLVEERNHVLARHIRAASMQVLTPPRAVRQRGGGKDGRTVVAVMGLAHLNGVKQLLTTSRAV